MDFGLARIHPALRRIAPPAAPAAADFRFVTGAYPNQLNNIAIRGRFAFVPSTGASPNGPTRFDVNTQSLLSAINLGTRTDANRIINMHSAVAHQTATPKRFVTQPSAIAFKTLVDEGYVISTGSNVAVKVKSIPPPARPLSKTTRPTRPASPKFPQAASPAASSSTPPTKPPTS